MMRIDGKELDKNVVKLNEKKYLKEFEEKDLELLK
jgi:hypothetical protein